MTFTPLIAWASFGGCLLLILYSGSRLSRYGDLIAAHTGLGGTWIGVLLVAAVTSLPELVTGFSAILVVGQPDLAVGGALGSCVFNLMILVILDFVHRGESLYTRIHHGHVLSAAFSVMMLGMVAGTIVLHGHFPGLRVGPIDVFTPAVVIVYAVGIRSVFHYEREERRAYVEEVADVARTRAFEGGLGLTQLYVRYAANALVVVAAGLALPAIAEVLADMMGWQRTFVGTTFLAFATSIPEIVISVEAVRIGAVDLAIGNLLGSNLFDLLIIGLEDLVYLDGSLLAAASVEHLFTTIAALTMTGVFVAGLTYPSKARVARLVGWTSLALLTIGTLNALILFLLG